MTRRLFLLAAPAVVIAGSAPQSPRNEVCTAANEFHAPYAGWADRMNAPHPPGTVQFDAVEAFEPLPNLWRHVERKFRAWVRGN